MPERPLLTRAVAARQKPRRRRTSSGRSIPHRRRLAFLALLATVLARVLRLSTSLAEIGVGMLASFVADRLYGPESFGAQQEWLRFIASLGSVLLTFLAGAELDPRSLRTKWKEVLVVGFIGFLSPFLGCTVLTRFLLGAEGPASWLVGIALSTTSMAVVYAVMLESGFHRTDFGKGILGACFINDLGAVLAWV